MKLVKSIGNYFCCSFIVNPGFSKGDIVNITTDGPARVVEVCCDGIICQYLAWYERLWLWMKSCLPRRK